jgi:hypothetical protein
MYNVINNPIPTSKLFVTPENENELFTRLEQYTGAERALAFQVAMMTMNLCNKIVEEKILSKEVFVA